MILKCCLNLESSPTPTKPKPRYIPLDNAVKTVEFRGPYAYLNLATAVCY